MPVSLAEPLMSLDETQFARLTADEYQRMTESGMLREAPMELLDGFMVWKDRRDREGSIMNIGVRHGNCVDRLHRMLDRRCDGHGCHARTQQALRVSLRDVPEPDVMILKGEPDDYDGRQPEAADALLVIEVADRSLKFDREDKRPKYAAAGIAEYWIVNLLDDRIETHKAPDPKTASYGEILELVSGDLVTVMLPDGAVASFDVARILR
jgi:Uma2 family endonuclease